MEDVIAWLAQRTDKTSICRLLRVSWQTVHRTVTRVVAEHLDGHRLDDLYRLGVEVWQQPCADNIPPSRRVRHFVEDPGDIRATRGSVHSDDFWSEV